MWKCMTSNVVGRRGPAFAPLTRGGNCYYASRGLIDGAISEGVKRGRFRAQWIFLPFADGDPKTAEVTSKVVPPPNDDKTQDSTNLEQLR